MPESDVVKQIRSQHPFPWREFTHPTGLIEVADANDKAVPLLTFLKLTLFLTNVMAAQPTAQPSQETQPT